MTDSTRTSARSQPSTARQQKGEAPEAGAAQPNKLRVWDLPTRLFHWLLVVTLGVSAYTGLTGGFTEMDIHMTSGGVALSLIGFRVLWGFWGGHYARFWTFWPSPSALKNYFKADQPVPGHSPLAGLSIFALLICVAIQAGTGLFANDDIFTEGPLAHWVSYETSRRLTAIHETNWWILSSLIGLHLGAIAIYELKKGRRLIMAMITGDQWHLEIGVPADDSWRRRMLALTLLVISSGCVYGFIYY